MAQNDIIPASSSKPPGLPTARQSRPPNFVLNPHGALSVIPRRGWEGLYENNLWEGPLSTNARLYRFAAAYPGRLSEILGTTHPTVAKAQSNWIAAAAAPGTAKLVAYKNGATGQQSQDDDATAEINAWLKAMGPGIGGLAGLRVKGVQSILHYGAWFLEGVPGVRGTGVRQIGLVDPPSIHMGNDQDGQVSAFQYQPDAPEGKKVLSPETFFWYTHYDSITNSYGLAVFATALTEALKDFAFDQDTSDAVHNSAWQRYIYKYSQEALYRIATTPLEQGGLGLTATNAQAWVKEQLDNIQKYLAGLQPGDNMVADASGGVDTLASASFQGIEAIATQKDYRLIRACDEMPTTMGAPKAGAQNYTTAEWASQATKQEMVAWGALGPIVQVANLHFRLQGRPITVEAKLEPIRKSDAVQDANAESVQHKTRVSRWMLGLITKEELSLEETGSGLPEDDPDAYTGPDPAQTGNTETDTVDDTAPLPAAGTTQEEKDAVKGA